MSISSHEVYQMRCFRSSDTRHGLASGDESTTCWSFCTDMVRLVALAYGRFGASTFGMAVAAVARASACSCFQLDGVGGSLPSRLRMVAHPTARSGLACIEDLQVAVLMHRIEVRAVDPREISTLGWRQRWRHLCVVPFMKALLGDARDFLR